jgi:hypothetical protein
MQTIEQVLKANNISLFESTSNTSILRCVNKILRSRDDSHLWPISGKYNATNRAIRYYSRIYFNNNGPCSVYEYISGINQLISNYVNK